MTARNEFERRVAAAWPPASWQDVTVLVAVSGGADSVALLRALGRLKSGGAGRLLAGHYNHALRGADAAADEQFVVELCRQLGVECRLGWAPAGAIEQQGDSLEAAARAARYHFLQAAAEEAGARYLVTGHTADDQAETVMHRILRGTGIAGLVGIPRVRALGPAVSLLRPLLDARRREVEAYLSEIGQDYRTDETNWSVALTRSRLRHELLPALAAEYNPAIAAALLRLSKLAGDAQNALEWQADRLLDAALVSGTATDIVLNCDRLIGVPRHLVRETMVLVWQRQAWPLQAMGFDEWDELAGMILGGAGGTGPSIRARNFPGHVTAASDGRQLCLSRVLQ